MNSLQFNYAKYESTFKFPFQTAKSTLYSRKGIIITLKNTVGITGIGEAAPLPEFGSETFEQAEEAIRNFKLDLKLDINNFIESLQENLPDLDLLPAAKHGIEQSIINLICNEKKVNFFTLINRDFKKEINVNALIGFNSPQNSALLAHDFMEDGFETIKIKIGRENFNEDLNCLNAVREVVKDKINLRADVNGKWSLSQAKGNIKLLEQYNLEYIEQPLNKIEDFLELSQISKIPLAADESIRNLNDAENFITQKAASVLILKPMMLGGIINTIQIMDLAKAKNIKTIITTSLESVVGRTFAILAAAMNETDSAHGLNTGRLFEDDLAEDPFPVLNGKINLVR